MYELLEDEQGLYLRMGAEPASPAERQASNSEQCLGSAIKQVGPGSGSRSPVIGGSAVAHALEHAPAPFATICACDDNSAADVR